MAYKAFGPCWWKKLIHVLMFGVTFQLSSPPSNSPLFFHLEGMTMQPPFEDSQNQPC